LRINHCENNDPAKTDIAPIKPNTGAAAVVEKLSIEMHLQQQLARVKD